MTPEELALMDDEELTQLEPKTNLEFELMQRVNDLLTVIRKIDGPDDGSDA